ncbi:hypothetical protein D3C71_1524530 [compost metagenome]
MAIAEDGGQRGVLDPFGVQEGRQRLGMRQRAAGEAQGFEGGSDLGFQVVGQFGGALGVLAFRGQRQAARQQGAEGA